MTPNWPSNTYDVTALLPPLWEGGHTRLSITCKVCSWHEVDRMTEAELAARLNTHWRVTHGHPDEHDG